MKSNWTAAGMALPRLRRPACCWMPVSWQHCIRPCSAEPCAGLTPWLPGTPGLLARATWTPCSVSSRTVEAGVASTCREASAPDLRRMSFAFSVGMRDVQHPTRPENTLSVSRRNMARPWNSMQKAGGFSCAWETLSRRGTVTLPQASDSRQV